MTRHFHPAARDELVATVDYYEEALPGLGLRCRDAVLAAVGRAEAYPNSGRQGLAGSRRHLISGFPYDLVYRMRGEVLEILAIAHTSRRPGYWRDRTTL